MPYKDKSHPNNKRIRAESLIRQRARNPLWHSIRQAYYSAKTRCNKNGVEFDIVISDLMVDPLVCALSGLEFKRGESGKANMFSPSIDRIRPHEGYTKGNVRLILFGLNAFKGQADDETLIAICRAVVEKNS